jgi:DNA-binding transcriptional LysR family regulator
VAGPEALDGEGLFACRFDSSIANDLQLMTRATLDGVGLAYLMDEYAAPYLASRALVEVLEDWSARFGGYFFYCPSHRQQPAALAALIAALRVDASERPARDRKSPQWIAGR